MKGRLILLWLSENKWSAGGWLIFLSLLAVLLPHTAWMFSQFEPVDAAVIHWAAAIAFEATILRFTHRLAYIIRANREAEAPWYEAYTNMVAAGLVVALLISAFANWSHAVEFASDIRVYELHGVSPLVFTLGFGGILPVMSFIMAHVLAEESTGTTSLIDVLIDTDNATVTAPAPTPRPAPSTAPALTTDNDDVSDDASDTPALPDRFDLSKMDDRLDAVVYLVDKHPDIDVGTIASALDKSARTVRRYYDTLVDDGRLARNGDGYRVPSRQ